MLSFFFCLEVFSTNLKQAMSEAYNYSPEILALRSKLKASNQEIAKVLGENRPKINFESRIGTDKTDTINTASVEKTQYNNPRSISIDITQNIYDSGKKIKNLEQQEAKIFSHRADLFAQEQEVLLKTAKTYLNLYEAIELNKLAKNNYEGIKATLRSN